MDDTQTLDLFTPDNGDEAAPIEQHASHAYLGYAVSTVKSRALPEIADGLKPVQRRILYAIGDTPGGGTSFSKCARFVGEVLGKYHPHGDSSTYHALVHPAHPSPIPHPLIPAPRNFGSADAMRGRGFPGGGQSTSPAEEGGRAYGTGRGSPVLKAKYEKGVRAGGQWRIVVTELPQGVSVRQVMEEIEGLANPKPGLGKKEVTQEQKRLKQFILDQVEGVRDESDRKSKLRLVIEPRSSRQNPEEMMAALLVHTSLESRYAVNLTWLGV